MEKDWKDEVTRDLDAELRRFWMVIRADKVGAYANSTSMRHSSLSSAEKEAKRLCQQERAPFVILQSILRISLPEGPFRWEGM